MDGYSISQVAERTGFAPSTLRFYEQSGLVRPARTPAGYRSFDDRHIELLRFIGRAKSFGLSLEEITELLSLLDEDRCAPVQARLRALVNTKIADAQQRIGDLVGFAAELQRVSSALTAHTPDGPCDNTCGCTTDQEPNFTGVSLTAKPPNSPGTPVACTLAADQVGIRLGQWQSTLAQATGREAIDGGVRLRFADGVDVSGLTALAVAEQDCCSFFTFTFTIDGSGLTFDVTGPDSARPVIEALVGTAP